MGLLDMIGMGGPEGKLRRLTKKLQEKFGPPENRQGAIEELGALKTEAAIDALLLRFTFRVDPGITDDEEKQHVHALVVEAGPAALPAVKRFILTRDEISWPLRALGALLPEPEVIAVLGQALRKAAIGYHRVTQEKVLLLPAISHPPSDPRVPRGAADRKAERAERGGSSRAAGPGPPPPPSRWGCGCSRRGG